MDYFTLNTGQKVPEIGFGSWEIRPDEAARDAVTAALDAGYRVIDTAHIYRNETGVGAAIRDSGLPREDLFVTTKLWNDEQGYDSTLKAFERQLGKLGLDYLDLYLIHWPATSRRFDSWRALVRLYDEGAIKAAGVSNFTVEHLEELAGRSKLKPAVNQVEFHPFIFEQQQILLDYCEGEDILIEAYSPLRRVSQEGHGVIEEVAGHYAKSPQQVVLRWCIQHRTLPLPRSNTPAHIRSNFDVFDFEIDERDMRSLDSLSDGERVTWDPSDMG